MKSPYPFSPTEDSLLGQILMELFKERGRQVELQSIFQSYLEEGQTSFHFTPNSTKSTLMTILPSEFRKVQEEGNSNLLTKKFEELLQPPIKMDVVLEILEWIITGIADSEISINILNLFLKKNIIDKDILNIIIKKYDEMVVSEV